MITPFFLLAAGFGPVGPGAEPPAPAQNILVLVVDDLGIDMVAAYGEGGSSLLASTPVLSSLAANGVLFRNAYANPVCSPTRATIHTGRYSFRTGLGDVVREEAPFSNGPLSFDEILFPEMLSAAGSSYATAAIGKWHLDTMASGGPCAPVMAGYDYFSGVLPSLTTAQQYYVWPKYTWNEIAGTCQQVPAAPVLPPGCPLQPTWRYATTSTVDESIVWIEQQAGPWVCYVSFNSPHVPFHAPPPELVTPNPPLANQVPQNEDPLPYLKAMVESIDSEIGRLFHCIDPVTMANTNVIFLSDNGPVGSDRVSGQSYDLALPPFDPDRAKGTVYEAGINVPLIVSGPVVNQPGRESPALVNTTDLFATIADMASVDLGEQGFGCGPGQTKLDSISFLPVLKDPCNLGDRTFVFAERFLPNFDPEPGAPLPTPTIAHRAISDGRYKLITREYNLSHSLNGTPSQFGPPPCGSGCEEFYDLLNDPWENDDLLKQPLGSLPADAQTQLQTLRVKLLTMLAGGCS